MKKLSSILILLFPFFLAAGANATADDLLIRSSATPETPWLGQKVTVHIDVLTTDGWASVKTFRNPQVQGGYLIRFETQGTRLNEKIGSDSYSGQRYEFFFFAQHAGRLAIPEIPLDVEVKSWGRPAASGLRQKSAPAIILSVKTPPGTESAATMISTTEYRAEQEWEFQVEKLQVGDAVTRTVTRRGTDVSAMLFSPLTFQELDGMQAYPAEPVLNDNYNKGDLSGERVDKVTYVLEQPGTYKLPELEFLWWDVGNEELRKIVLPERSLTVSGEPVRSPATHEQPETGDSHKFSVAKSLVILLVLGILFFYRNQIKDFYHRRREIVNESEHAYFQRIKDGARRNDHKAVLRATMQWLDRIAFEPSPARLGLFLKRYGDRDAQHAAEELMGPAPTTITSRQLRNFTNGVTRSRSRWRIEKKRRQKADTLLPKIQLSG